MSRKSPEQYAWNPVFSCEHAVNAVPEEFRHYFLRCGKILNSHRGFDAGALDLAEFLSVSLKAPLHRGRVTRLLVDLNRSPGRRSLFSEYLKKAPQAVKKEILSVYYIPYVKNLQKEITDTIGKYGSAAHFSVHSFTPVLDGKQRKNDIGILYDPSRQKEKVIADVLSAILKKNTDLKIYRNLPYRGTSDGMTAFFRKRFRHYAGIELEISQKLLLKGRFPADLKQAVLAAAAEACHLQDSKKRNTSGSSEFQ